MLCQLADSLVLVYSVLTCLLFTSTFSFSDSPFCSSNIFICISAFKPDTLKAQYLCYHILFLHHLPAFALQQVLWYIHAAQQPKWGGGGWKGLGARLGTGCKQQSRLTADAGVGGTASLPSLGGVQEHCSGRLGAMRLRAGSAGQTASPARNRAPARWCEALPSYLQVESF